MSDEREAIRYDEDQAVRSTADEDDDVEAHAMREQVREAVRAEGEDQQVREQIRE